MNRGLGMDTSEDEQQRTWEHLYGDITCVLTRFCNEDHFGKGDYLLVDDNYGWQRHTIEVHKLHMLRPEIVAQLRRLLNAFPDWEIVMAVDVPGTELAWPRMGLTVRKDEVVDDLNREFLPEEIKRFQFG